MPRKRKAHEPPVSSAPAGAPRRKPDAGEAGQSELRIIGGHFRGRKLLYHGDPIVRPMKHRIREAIFNLISTEVQGLHAIDLFAGTGALGLEALSRGATRATFIEKHVPSARIVAANIATLDVEDRTELLVSSAFLWAKRDLISAAAARTDEASWLLFCSPPYAFYVDRSAEMLDLVQRIQDHAPRGSILVIEADERFDFDRLTSADPEAWTLRAYAPASIGIWRGD